jgi:hypothetical protein
VEGRIHYRKAAGGFGGQGGGDGRSGGAGGHLWLRCGLGEAWRALFLNCLQRGWGAAGPASSTATGAGADGGLIPDLHRRPDFGGSLSSGGVDQLQEDGRRPWTARRRRGPAAEEPAVPPASCGCDAVGGLLLGLETLTAPSYTATTPVAGPGGWAGLLDRRGQRAAFQASAGKARARARGGPHDREGLLAGWAQRCDGLPSDGPGGRTWLNRGARTTGWARRQRHGPAGLFR